VILFEFYQGTRGKIIPRSVLLLFIAAIWQSQTNLAEIFHRYTQTHLQSDPTTNHTTNMTAVKPEKIQIQRNTLMSIQIRTNISNLYNAFLNVSWMSNKTTNIGFLWQTR
jgi:hypothetical protein